MRRFIVVLLITVCLGSAQASVGQVVDSVIQSSKSVVTTATEKGKESVRFVDTSSNFKNIYSDIKAGLIGLAAGGGILAPQLN